jgi:cytochrome P450
MLNDKAPNTGDYVRLQAIYGHVINLMVAGHETTATTLAWTLLYISRHPDVEAKALAEIKAVLGDANEPSAEHIPKLVYLEACFREALRLHPAVTDVSRDAAADTLLKVKAVLGGSRANALCVSICTNRTMFVDSPHRSKTAITKPGRVPRPPRPAHHDQLHCAAPA